MIHYHYMEQGSPEWLDVRCGVLTASEMKHIITPTLKIANNDKTRTHLYELAAQRITRFVEESYVSENMMRGNFDEVYARIIYNDKISPVKECGFITNDKWGFTLGYSPDALVGDAGLIEIKSRKQKFQIQTIATDTVDADFIIQLQTGLLVSERKWCDFVQYSSGMPMYVKRVFPDPVFHEAILEASAKFEKDITALIEKYLTNAKGLIMTERKVYSDIIV